ncbi:MAG: hypothetical protein Q4Q23_05850 [Methanobacteriaceae archaeon]|nr:hypothetical protein [Methanobacteriaceae archaeon]
MKVCPGSAMNGENWDINKKTQDFYDPKTCAIRVKKNFEGKLANNLTIWVIVFIIVLILKTLFLVSKFFIFIK